MTKQEYLNSIKLNDIKAYMIKILSECVVVDYDLVEGRVFSGAKYNKLIITNDIIIAMITDPQKEVFINEELMDKLRKMYPEGFRLTSRYPSDERVTIILREVLHMVDKPLFIIKKNAFDKLLIKYKVSRNE